MLQNSNPTIYGGPARGSGSERKAGVAGGELTLAGNPGPAFLSTGVRDAESFVAPVQDRESKVAVQSERDAFSSEEIFEIIRHINDPEHPLTLEQLNVAQLENIHVDDEASKITVHFTPTIPHCSMATLIGLSIRTKLMRSLPVRFKYTVAITPGTHNQEKEVNKQLNDKERVAAALENPNLLGVVNKCIGNTDR